MGLGMVGMGVYLPARTRSNDEVAETLDVSAEWIVSRTGVRERRVAAGDETTAAMASSAAAAALVDAGITAEDIRLVVATSSSAEQLTPAVAALVQARLSAHRAVAFDVSAACSGFLYGLHVIQAMHEAGRLAGPALLIGTERLTATADPRDRGSASILGDGAGAVILAPVPHPGGLLATVIGSEAPADPPVAIRLDPTMPGGARMTMTGHRVRDFALRLIPEAARLTLEAAGAELEEIDHFVPHQANPRLVTEVAAALDMPMDRVAVTGDVLGNTGSASIPLTLHALRAQGRLRHGQLVLCAAIGAGMTWAGALLRWTGRP
ncbi:3-oxoacyl-ACP synthase III family protein [Kitasatospora sp. NPDC127116]|uniref:3-oxoacyl-ACP synthase III family protein n=1 Tax=Kitasatospora sp. NPDC127116 TaxID=3345367 RepID=UPI0036389C38